MQYSVFRSAISVAAVATALCLPAAGQAQTRSFNVPAQPASSSVRVFAQQAGIQVIVAGEDTDGRTTNLVKGNLDTRAALDQLLAGTGLVVRSFDGKVAILGAEAQASTDEEDAIVVTGSRVARPEYESAMPVSVTRMDEALSLGRITAYDALARDPAMGVGISIGAANSGSELANWDSGISAVNLRNLGTNRTLTLIDGQRRVSSSARSSAVDIGTIPVGMIDRVEVVTGGAAAIYGADAVTGAVNIVTKKHIDGLNAQVTTGISSRGDANEFMASLATGGKFADGRGAFSIGGTYAQASPIYFTDRIDPETALLYVANPANTGVSDGIPNRVLSEQFRYIYMSYQPTYALNGKEYILENGIPREASYDTIWNTSALSNGDGGDGRNYWGMDELRSRYKTLALMGRVNYEITDDIEYAAHFSYARQKYFNRYTVHRDDSRQGFIGATLENPFVPEALRQIMIANGLESLPIRRSYGNFPIRSLDHDRESFNLGQSLGGKLSDTLRWTAFWQYGRTVDKSVERNLIFGSHWAAARDVVVDPGTGQPMCRDAAARAAGCVPVNIFSTASPGQDVLDYVMWDRHERTANTQQIFGTNLNGRLFTLPYGDVSFAAGVEHRRETLQTKDDPRALEAATSGSTQGNQTVVHSELDVSSKVTEFYGELVVPVLSGLPFAHRLEVEAAYRFSDYNTIGSTDTWKVGATWAPLDWLSFRGVRSRSVRAPNFGELYEPQAIAQTGTNDDPCAAAFYFASETRAANCRALGIATPLGINTVGPDVTTGGDPDLKPETSNSLTLGVVLRPRFVPGLDMTVDYWDINISNVITQFSFVQTLFLCVDLPTIDNPFCANSTRDPVTHAPETVKSTQMNVARLKARGIDIGASYRLPLGDGRLDLSFKGTVLLKNVTQTTPGLSQGDIIADGTWRNPRFRATLYTAYTIDKFRIGLDTRLIGASKYDKTDYSPEAWPDNTVPAKIYNDLSLQYDASEAYSIGVGVRNLFDVKPPYMPTLYKDNSVYDQIGRYFFVTANLRL